MNDFILDVEELENGNAEPQVAFVLKRDGDELLRTVARVFSEDDMIAASNAIAMVGNGDKADIDQIIASLIEPIRIRWLRTRENGEQEPRSDQNLDQPVGELPSRYIALLPGTDEADGTDEVREASIRDLVNNRVLANFVLIINEDIEMQDDVESRREFAGQLTIFDRTVPFQITAGDFADNGKLKAALFEAGGCELLINCSMDELRKAISTISRQAGQIRVRRLTTNFGWTEDGTTYLSPSLHISQNGIETVSEESDLRVDLTRETPACNLDLKQLDRDELKRVKTHVVEDLLKLNDRVVTHTLLGATAAAILYRFAKGCGRFALWLVGQTGGGKSFAAKLFSNFFGNFPISSAPFSNWSATPYYVQRQGYYFKDCLYLVDDYKPEIIRNPNQMLGVLQTYADNTARGRLKSDATANVLRPIRGLLVCTGEDMPEHNASAVARSVIVRFPQQAKNLPAGTRCISECENYAGVTADFIRWLLAEKRTAIFARRLMALQDRYYSDVVGQQNDIRVASNLAQLGAAFELFAEYLCDVWPDWREAVRLFVDVDLVATRDAMLGEAKEQQASEVFLRTLAELIRFNHVRIDNWSEQRDAEHKPRIGRFVGAPAPIGAAVLNQGRLEICMSLAMAEVNACLRQQGRPELRPTHSAILTQLREDGKLLDQNGEPLGSEADVTRRIRLNGAGQVRVFTIRWRDLLGE